MRVAADGAGMWSPTRGWGFLDPDRQIESVPKPLRFQDDQRRGLTDLSRLAEAVEAGIYSEEFDLNEDDTVDLQDLFLALEHMQ